jgi:serine/threonine protein kinase
MLVDDTTMDHSVLCSTLDERPRRPGGREILESGRSFARYRITRCIGVGGMGAVYEAEHSLLRKPVALKTMHSTRGSEGGARARFLREAEIVARIRHPNVVDITDVGVEQETPFLVMELLEGEDLAALLTREGPLTAQQAVDLLLPATAGLAAAHRLGIVHRDVKPENVFLASDSLGDLVVKIVDFGVSKDLHGVSGRAAESGCGSHELRHTVAGTPHYMAPEQVRGAGVLDGRTDQYALGVLLYQCLTGVRPFEADSLLELVYRIDAGDCRPLRELRPELPEELEAIVKRAMARRIEDRFPDTESFGQALSGLASRELREAYARDFAPERRSSVPPPRRSGAGSIPAPRAGWIRESSVRAPSSRFALDVAGARWRRGLAALTGFGWRAALLLIATLLSWRAVQGYGVGATAGAQPAAPGWSRAPELEAQAASLVGFGISALCAKTAAR